MYIYIYPYIHIMDVYVLYMDVYVYIYIYMYIGYTYHIEILWRNCPEVLLFNKLGPLDSQLLKLGEERPRWRFGLHSRFEAQISG